MQIFCVLDKLIQLGHASWFEKIKIEMEAYLIVSAQMKKVILSASIGFYYLH